MTYFVETVSGGREWEGQYGVNVDFQLKLQGVEKPAILTQKPSTPVPKAGDSLDLTLEPHPRFEDKMKAKRVQQFAGGGGGGKDFKADPVKQAAIAMESCQKVAMDLLRLAVETEAWKPAEFPIKEMTGVIKTVAQSLYSQINEVSEAAK